MESKILQWLSIGAAVIAVAITIAFFFVQKKLNAILKRTQDDADHAAVNVQGDPMSIVFSGESAPKDLPNETHSNTQLHITNPR